MAHARARAEGGDAEHAPPTPPGCSPARSPTRTRSSFVENKTLYFRREEVADGAAPVPLGRASVVRAGRDVTVVALSRLVGEALAAAEELAAEGIEVEVIDPRTLVPLDLETIVASVARTHRLVVAHEAVQHGGFGAEIAAQVQAAAFDELDAPIARVGRARSRRSRSARRSRTRTCPAARRCTRPHWPRTAGSHSVALRRTMEEEHQ